MEVKMNLATVLVTIIVIAVSAFGIYLVHKEKRS